MLALLTQLDSKLNIKMDWIMYLFIQKPVYQILMFLVLTPILVIIIQPKHADSAWGIATAVFVLFLIVNAGLVWFDANPWRYFFYSLGCAVVYVLVISIIMRGLVRVLRLDGSEESAMGFLILIYQPFALLLVMLVKWIVTKWF